MAKATYEYPAETTFRDAARIALEGSFRKMMKHAAGTRSGVARREPNADEVEALHDMRVGSRRLRSALALFAGVFPKADFREMDKQVGAITDALGAVRDLDVQLDSLRSLQANVLPNEAYGVSRLVARQTEQRDIERKALQVALDRLKKSRFERHFEKTLDAFLPPRESTAKPEDGG